MSVSSPVALITGGASNIGLATARRFAATHRVVIADRIEAGAAAESLGGITVCGDTSREEDVHQWVARAENLGTLNVVVHCAGITKPFTPIADLPLDEWEEVIRVNLTGSFILAKAVIPALRRSAAAGASASLVMIASRAGKTGFATLGTRPDATKAHYCASKAGVISLTKSLAIELAADGIRVNAVAPGPVAGTMIPAELWSTISARVPLGRLAQADEIAAGAVYLCSADAGFITGHILDINGGTLMD